MKNVKGKESGLWGRPHGWGRLSPFCFGNRSSITVTWPFVALEMLWAVLDEGRWLASFNIRHIVGCPTPAILENDKALKLLAFK